MFCMLYDCFTNVVDVWCKKPNHLFETKNCFTITNCNVCDTYWIGFSLINGAYWSRMTNKEKCFPYQTHNSNM